MSYVITDTDFIFPYEIPLTQDMNSKAANQLSAIIDERCRLLLRQVLGNANFVAFDAVLDPTTHLLPDPPTGVAQKWVDLINGSDYVLDDIAYHWIGLKPLLVKYVYYGWLYQTVSYLGGVGLVKADAKNAAGVNPLQELTQTWLYFLNDYQGSARFGVPVGNVYHIGIPQYDGYYVDTIQNKSEASLVQYISQFPDLYPDTTLYPMTQEGITNQLSL